MRVAITGGTGFVGRHLAKELTSMDHEVVLIARGIDRRHRSAYGIPGVQFFRADLSNATELRRAFSACGAVAHCAGMNREMGRQTYQRVHIEGTGNVVQAARLAGVGKVALLSFLRARPNCGSGYHESKWTAEEIVRSSDLDYTIFKAGVIYGPGDHMLDHLSHALYTFPSFALVGMKDKPVRPLAVRDLARVVAAALAEDRLSRQTVAMLVSLAQVRILSEGIVDPWPPFDPLPIDLMPATRFTDDQIRRGLPEPGKFGLKDLRWRA